MQNSNQLMEKEQLVKEMKEQKEKPVDPDTQIALHDGTECPGLRRDRRHAGEEAGRQFELPAGQKTRRETQSECCNDASGRRTNCETTDKEGETPIGNELEKELSSIAEVD